MKIAAAALSAAFSATLGLAAIGGAMAQQPERVVLNYADDAFRNTIYEPAPALRAGVAKSLAARADARRRLGADFLILGETHGAFTQQGARERILLLSNKAPVASDPSPKGMAQYLAVMERDSIGALYVLPGSRIYARLSGAIDADRSGRDEVLVEVSAYNMGQSVTTLDRLVLGAGGDVSIAQTLQGVFDDNCNNPRGKREKIASVVVLDSARKTLAAKPQTLKCD